MKINDVAELVGVSASSLRYWEKKLNLDVPRDEYGSRTFDAEWVAYFKQVKALLDEDLGWDEIGKQLQQPGAPVSSPVDPQPSEPPSPPAVPTPAQPEPPGVDPEDFAKWKKQVQKKFAAQSEVIASLQAENKTLQGSHERLQKQIKGLQGEITGLQTVLEPLQGLQKNFFGWIFGIFLVFFLIMVAVLEGFR